MPAPAVTTKQAAIRRIDEIAASAMALFGQASSLEEELQVAQAMTDLRAALTPEVMAPIMALMNTNIGFRTDRDPTKSNKPITPYSVEVVKEVFIEARLRGFHTVGNEFNIISGGFYAAKNGLQRKVTTYPAVTEFKAIIGVPKSVAGGAIVECEATWKKEGVADSLKCSVPVKVNEYMGADAIIGKAQRKLLARVYDQLSGTITPEADLDDVPLIGASPAPSQPLFQGQTPSTPQPTPQNAPEANSEQPRATPEPAQQPKNALTEAKAKIIRDISAKMTADNIGIDQVMTHLIAKGEVHQEATMIEEVPTSRLVILNANWDTQKAEMSAIEV